MAIQPVTNTALPSTLMPSLPSARPIPTQTTEAPAAVDGSQAPGAQRDATSPQGTEAKSSSVSPDRKQLEEALTKIQKAVGPVAQNLLFSIDEDTGKTVIKVVDSSTKETIRQIPSEEVLSIVKALDKLQGLLIKQEA